MQPLSPFTKKSLLSVGCAVLLLLIIGASYQVGFHSGLRKAQFFGSVGDNYRHTFGEPRPGPIPQMNHLPNDRGAFGTIISMNESTLVVADREGIEKTILITPTTEIRKFRDGATLNDLAVGATIITAGTPNDAGQIVAALIRIMPSDMPPGITPEQLKALNN
jgi:hypothetical protein